MGLIELSESLIMVLFTKHLSICYVITKVPSLNNSETFLTIISD